MKLSELIASSARIRTKNTTGHYSAEYTYSNKQLGKVLQYNKTVLYKPESSIVEIGMYIKSVTEYKKSGHFCQIALRGIKMEVKSEAELFQKLRSRNKGKLAKATEDELRDYIAAGNTVYNGKYVVQSRNNSKAYLVMDKNVSADTECRVKCSCASFLFTMSWYNAKAGCLIGNPMPYPKHKFNFGNSNETVMNLDKRPGMCKHLMLMVSLLMEEGFIMGGTDDVQGYVQGVALQGLADNSKAMQRISTARADYYVEQTLKQVRAQTKMINAIVSGNYNVKQGALRGTEMGKILSSTAKTYKALQPKKPGRGRPPKPRKPDLPFKKRKKDQ